MQDLQRIEKIFRLLGSTHDGEIINAVNSIRKILVAQDKNFSDLANHLFSGSSQHPAYRPTTDSFYQNMQEEYRRQQQSKAKNNDAHYKKCEFLINMPQVMTQWESTFIEDMFLSLGDLQSTMHKFGPSRKQEEWLNKIYSRYAPPAQSKGTS